MINLVLGAFLSGFLGIFTGITDIKIYQGEIEDVIGNALINHGKKPLGKTIKKIFGTNIPILGKSISQILFEYLLAGGFTMLVQTAVNMIIHYLMNVMMNYVLPFITWITATMTGWDILVPFTIYGDKKI